MSSSGGRKGDEDGKAHGDGVVVIKKSGDDEEDEPGTEYLKKKKCTMEVMDLLCTERERYLVDGIDLKSSG